LKRKANLHNLNGVLLLDKPQGLSTSFCSRKIGFELGKIKSGHAGTLDPFATGLVVVLLGKATRISDYLMILRKTYSGTIKFGVKTSTGDLLGDVISERSVDINAKKLREIASGLIGKRMQTPPKYSAIKISGKPLYRYALSNENIEIPEREIEVFDFKIANVKLPEVSFLAKVGKGTYLRAIAEEFGEIAGCGAHLTALRRHSVGSFQLENAITFDKAIELIKAGELGGKLINPASAIGFPQLFISKEDALLISDGRHIAIPKDKFDGLFSLVYYNRLIAIAKAVPGSPKNYEYECVLEGRKDIENGISETAL
jgi:tRNA pseudouridine55 synthase